MGPKWVQNGVKMGPKWGRNGVQNGVKMGSKWGRNGVEMGQNGVNMGSKWGLNGVEMGPMGVKMGSKWVKMGSDGSEMGPEWGLNGVKMGSKWGQNAKSGVLRRAAFADPAGSSEQGKVLFVGWSAQEFGGTFCDDFFAGGLGELLGHSGSCWIIILPSLAASVLCVETVFASSSWKHILCRIAGMLGLDACAAEVVATSMLPASPEGTDELSTTVPSDDPSATATSANSDVSEVPSATSALANSDGADDPSAKEAVKPRPAHYVNKLAAKMRKRREAAAAQGREVRSYVKRSELEVMNHVSKESCQTRDAVTNAKDQILSRLGQLEYALAKPKVKAKGEGQGAPKASRKKADPEEKKRKAEEKKVEAETKKRKAEAAKAERAAKAEEKARAKAAKAAATAQKAAEALKKFDGNGHVSSVPSEPTKTEKIEGCPDVASAAPGPTEAEKIEERSDGRPPDGYSAGMFGLWSGRHRCQ